MSKYTRKNLDKIREQYNKNFEKMKTAEPKSDIHLKYIQRERELNKLEIEIMKDLGLFMPDPCPLTLANKRGMTCFLCPGRYAVVLTGNKELKETRLPDINGECECSLKKYLDKTKKEMIR